MSPGATSIMSTRPYLPPLLCEVARTRQREPTNKSSSGETDADLDRMRGIVAPDWVSVQPDLQKLESSPPMLDLRRLQIFRKVATLHSFSAAALELSYT